MKTYEIEIKFPATGATEATLQIATSENKAKSKVAKRYNQMLPHTSWTFGAVKERPDREVLDAPVYHMESLDVYAGQCGACACRHIFVGPDDKDTATVDCERCGVAVEVHRVVIERGRIVTPWSENRA